MFCFIFVKLNNSLMMFDIVYWVVIDILISMLYWLDLGSFENSIVIFVLNRLLIVSRSFVFELMLWYLGFFWGLVFFIFNNRLRR